MDPTMNLISGTHYSCERKKYAFIVLRKYIIIFLVFQPKAGMHGKRAFQKRTLKKKKDQPLWPTTQPNLSFQWVGYRLTLQYLPFGFGSMFNNYNLLVAKHATEQLQVLESLRLSSK